MLQYGGPLDIVEKTMQILDEIFITRAQISRGYGRNSPSFFLRSVLFVFYAPAEVIIFFSADIPTE